MYQVEAKDPEEALTIALNKYYKEIIEELLYKSTVVIKYGLCKRYVFNEAMEDCEDIELGEIEITRDDIEPFLLWEYIELN